jgi:uncharacterized membrane protein
VTVEEKTESAFDASEVSDDDRLWAALAWIPITPLWPIVAIIMLVIEEKKDRPFIRYHSILALATGVVGIVLSVFCIGILVWLAMFYFAFKAYQGEQVRIPVLTDFAEGQGWV